MCPGCSYPSYQISSCRPTVGDPGEPEQQQLDYKQYLCLLTSVRSCALLIDALEISTGCLTDTKCRPDLQI